MSTLTTERLALHLLTIAEAQRIADAQPTAADRWAPEFPAEGDRAGAGMFAKSTAEREFGPFGNYRIDRRADGVAIGSLGFYGPPDAEGRVTIGYGLVEAERGQGYATEAVRALIELCRAHADVTVVEADTNHDNSASQRVLAKSGFHYLRKDDLLLYYSVSVA
jgi:RimJ/RimL family protein N-acetyltransferase